MAEPASTRYGSPTPTEAWKDRPGRLGYIWAGVKNVRATLFDATITIEGTRWFKGTATCVLVANVGKLFGGVELFEGRGPTTGCWEVGVLYRDPRPGDGQDGGAVAVARRRGLRPDDEGGLGAHQDGPEGPL